MTDSEIDKSTLCPAHIPLIRELTKIGTRQEALIENQKADSEKLDQIRTALEVIKLTAATNRMETLAELKEEKLKIKPIYWILGVAGTAAIYEFWHWIGKMVLNRP